MQDNEKFNMNKTVEAISEYAPLVLFITMLLIFAITGYLQSLYYEIIFTDLFKDGVYLSILFPAVLQVLRLVTGFLSASFYKQQKYFFGTLVFLFSLWLTMYEHGEAAHMGDVWTAVSYDVSVIAHTENTELTLVKDVVVDVVQILIWSALVLEFFLAFWLGMKKDQDKPKPKTKGRPQAQKPKPQWAPLPPPQQQQQKPFWNFSNWGKGATT